MTAMGPWAGPDRPQAGTIGSCDETSAHYRRPSSVNLYSNEVQQRQLSRAALPIFGMLPDLLCSLSKLDRHEFTPKRSAQDLRVAGDAHLRWPQIVFAGPTGVNPAARPDPAGGDDEQACASGVVVG
jgi:hypothetical protein